MKRVRAALLALLAVAPLFAQTTMPSIEQVKEKHAARLLTLPGVVSVGIGRGTDGGKAIVIGLDRPRPETESKLPQLLEGYPLRIEVIGPVRPR
jgi:hypothetical protein